MTTEFSIKTNTSLPAYLTPLVGREQELTELTQLLLSTDVRILTLIGIGGIGKTRLGLEVSSQLSAFFADGVTLVSLVSILSPEKVLPAIAQAIGLRETGADDLSQRLYAHLHEQQILLLLDNFEQVLPAAAQLSALARACPSLKLLVTSRAVLHIQGEHEYTVAPLALPADTALKKEQLTHFAAINLFMKRAQAVKKAALLATPATISVPPTAAPALPVPTAYPAGLTGREVEVLRWVAHGLTDNQVAEKLVISPRTVSTHLTSIYNKLGISSRSAATRFAVEQQLL